MDCATNISQSGQNPVSENWLWYILIATYYIIYKLQRNWTVEEEKCDNGRVNMVKYLANVMWSLLVRFDWCHILHCPTFPNPKAYNFSIKYDCCLIEHNAQVQMIGIISLDRKFDYLCVFVSVSVFNISALRFHTHTHTYKPLTLIRSYTPISIITHNWLRCQNGTCTSWICFWI